MKNSILTWLASGPLLLVISASAVSTIHVPDPDKAILTIQDGINAARNGDTVLVADGTYYEQINFQTRLITVKSANGPEKCIIDGGGNHRGVTFEMGEGPAARLEGFTIQNCEASEGGGIHIQAQSSPTIANCIIQWNYALVTCGGGIYVYNASPTITNCTIRNNVSDEGGWYRGSGGGGISCMDHSSAVIANCIIADNRAGGIDGGGVYVYNSSPTIIGCTITNNSVSQDGGGISCQAGASPVIADCIISDNRADGSQGGGINIRNASPTISNCTISGNHAYLDGGISCWENSAPAIANCTISGNVCRSIMNRFAGGIGIDHSSPVLLNCVISGNTSGCAGGGITVIDSSFPQLINCTITGNRSTSTYPLRQAGGMHCRDSVPTIVNSIFWNDTPYEVLVENSAFYPNRVPLVSYSNLHWEGIGNIDTDPIFADEAAGDFRLHPDSPCIDRGSNSAAPETDIIGVVRPQDGDGDTIAVADMGAYEAPRSSTLLTDLVLNPSHPEYIPDLAFRNPQVRAALGQKLRVALLMIQRGDYRPALNQLRSDVLSKIDGCAADGLPDRDDWITNCNDQDSLYRRVTRAIEALHILLGGRD